MSWYDRPGCSRYPARRMALENCWRIDINDWIAISYLLAQDQLAKLLRSVPRSPHFNNQSQELLLMLFNPTLTIACFGQLGKIETFTPSPEYLAMMAMAALIITAFVVAWTALYKHFDAIGYITSHYVVYPPCNPPIPLPESPQPDMPLHPLILELLPSYHSMAN